MMKSTPSYHLQRLQLGPMMVYKGPPHEWRKPVYALKVMVGFRSPYVDKYLRKYQDGRWHRDPYLESASGVWLRPYLCQRGWHATDLLHLGVWRYTGNKVWLVQLKGKCDIGRDKVAAEYIRFVRTLSKSELEAIYEQQHNGMLSPSEQKAKVKHLLRIRLRFLWNIDSWSRGRRPEYA